MMCEILNNSLDAKHPPLTESISSISYKLENALNLSSKAFQLATEVKSAANPATEAADAALS